MDVVSVTSVVASQAFSHFRTHFSSREGREETDLGSLETPPGFQHPLMVLQAP